MPVASVRYRTQLRARTGTVIADVGLRRNDRLENRLIDAAIPG
jgi:hypothetical protein